MHPYPQRKTKIFITAAVGVIFTECDSNHQAWCDYRHSKKEVDYNVIAKYKRSFYT